MPQTDDPQRDEPQGAKRADGELAHAYEQIKSAQEELARLDQLVSGMERGGKGPPIRQPGGTGAEPGGITVNEAPGSRTSENKAARPGVWRRRPMLLALVGFLLAICIFGAAFASRYRNEAKAIMARWAPPVSIAHKETSEPQGPAKSLMAQVANGVAGGAADAGEQSFPPAVPSQKETKDVPSTGAATSADGTSADLAQSLKTIAHDVADINEKLDQLKSSYDQTLREHADAIQQLKTTQEQTARDNARIAGQIQALQAQLAALSAKSPPQSPKESDAAARQRQSLAATPRPRRPPAPRRLRPYMDEPWDDPYSYW